uniref:GH16 domain-containing protein n=1 Tax=Pyrodinium bahamense TaxID=73915 RepID=A0A7S0FNA9_9DINO|mmetsp:Transcript_39514/g.109878  ORF Transcript_39514/g.109878 Transcript_39514/m.109878 type:complete len:602 (+) Transcript_39514:56-1861(+)
MQLPMEDTVNEQDRSYERALFIGGGNVGALTVQSRSLHALQTSSMLRKLAGSCALISVAFCFYSGFSQKSALPATAVTEKVADRVVLFDFNNMDARYAVCFNNKTFYTELSGSHSMLYGQRSQEINPYMCQFRCTITPRCEHFSFWSDGGCHLTSYTSYPNPYTGPEDKGVIAGPRSCSSVVPEEPGPTLELEPAFGLPPLIAKEAEGCGGLHPSYDLRWKAEGRTFFDDWQFLTRSETHGAEYYLNKTDAFQAGVVYASDHGAIVRVGDQIMPFKRRSVMLHSAQAWRPDRGFVLAMKYRHLPYGAGIWPAFWLMNSDYLWPRGGELDILEFANDEGNKVSFHTSQNCSLNRRKLEECMKNREGVDSDVKAACYTNYTSNELGCWSQQIRRTGKWFAENPGVIATAWDASGVSVFHIPEAEIPIDLRSDMPSPNSWSKWLIAFLPFDAASCIDIAKPQEIVLNIALCGDWAGGAWWKSHEARSTGFVPPYCIPGNVKEPATDCCTIFMSHPTSEKYLKTRAYFDIEYIKVFEPTETEASSLSAGTYRNDGEPLEEPCVPCGTSRWIPNEQPGGGNVCCPGCGDGIFSMTDNGTLECPATA